MSLAPEFEARLAVGDLLGRYCRAADRLDRELLADVFAPDAAIDMGAIFRGDPAAFIDVVMGFMASFAVTRHELSTIHVAAHDADAAGYEAYVRAWHRIDTPEGARELVVLARYIGRAERRAEGWRITRHGEIVDWGEERALDTAWIEGGAAAMLPLGRRDRDDGSYAPLG